MNHDAKLTLLAGLGIALFWIQTIKASAMDIFNDREAWSIVKQNFALDERIAASINLSGTSLVESHDQEGLGSSPLDARSSAAKINESPFRFEAVFIALASISIGFSVIALERWGGAKDWTMSRSAN